MGWVVLLKFFAKVSSIIAWPSFSIVYPLCFSIWAIESKSYSRNQQCLIYWVLFSLIMIVELPLAEVLEWFPYWPYLKGMVTFLLAMPYFGGASYVYKHLIRPYVFMNSQISGISVTPRENCIMSKQNNFLGEAKGYFWENGPEESEKLIICQGKSGPSDDITERNYAWPTSQKKVQGELSCAVCLVTTKCQQCPNRQLQGKKHEEKEDEVATKSRVESSSMQKKASGIDLLENFNQIAWAKLEHWCDLLGPASNSITWCRWKKPEFGWTKLNTDGSVDRESAGFGGLLRDYNGDSICAYVSKAPRDDIFLVELWAVWRGLVLASSMGINVLWVESDSMSVVKTINKEQPYGPKAASCLKHIWDLLKKLDKYRVSHSWRETNRAADYLAKMDLSGSDVVLWPVQFPSSLCNIIKDDAQGRRYRRG